MPLTATELNKIERKADAIIRENGISSPSIPVETIAKKKGLNVIAYNLGAEISGVLVVSAGMGTIGFNPGDHKGRQRFTIAHELGHFILHTNSSDELFIDKEYLVKYRKDKPYTNGELRQELEANAFAAALLMPKVFIAEELEKSEYADLAEVKLIEKLAKVFNVSVPAMTYRLTNLNILV